MYKIIAVWFCGLVVIPILCSLYAAYVYKIVNRFTVKDNNENTRVFLLFWTGIMSVVLFWNL